MKDDLDRLVKRLKRGDLAVFDQIYERTYRKVYFKVIPILKDDALAHDIMQDAYMKVLDSIAAYEENNFVGYLLTIARNLAINEYNRRKRVIHSASLENDYSEFAYHSLVEISAANRELITECLALLDESEKNILLLHDVEGLKHKEIAAMIEKPIGTVTWLYARAIKKIREKLKREEER